MLLCTFLLASVGWAMAEEDGGGNSDKINSLATLNAAIDAATTENNTIVLTDNITDANSETGSAININKAIVLDGNGKTISGSAAEAILKITGTGAVTIKNLTVENTNSEYPYTDILVEKEAGNENAVTFNTVKLGGSGYAGIKIVGGSVVSIENVEEIKEHPTYGIQLSVKDNKAPALKIGAGNKFPYCWYQIRQDQQDKEYPAAITAGEGCGFSFLGQGVWTDRYNSESKTYTIPIQDRTPTVILYELNITASIADIIKIGAGELDLTELGPLKIDKSVTIEGAVNEKGTPATTLKRGSDWSGTDNDTKHMVNITASDVTLKNLVIDGNNTETGFTPEGSGINVYEASNVTLENVISKNNKGGGLIVNGSQVIAKNFHTEGNGYGINLDNGENVTGNPTLSIDANCSVAEISKIYGPASLDANSVTMPNGWITTTVTLKGTEYRVWTDKVITTNDNTVFANGYPVTITASENPDKVKIFRTAYPSDFVEVASASAVVYGGSLNASVDSTSITMTGGKLTQIYGGGKGTAAKEINDRKYADVTAEARITISGGTVTDRLIAAGSGASKVKKAVVTVTGNTTLNRVSGGGLAPTSIGESECTEYERIANGVEEVCFMIDGGAEQTVAIKEFVMAGGGFSYGYSKDVTFILKGAKVSGGVLGTGSNGRSDKVRIYVSNCDFTPSVNYRKEFAAINRGFVTDSVKMVFENCKFPTNNLAVYACATLAWQDGNYPTPTTPNTEMVFTNCVNTPTVGISEGLQNFTLTGANAKMDKFTRNSSTTITEFAIPAGNTWSISGDLEVAEDMTFNINGTLKVGGTYTVNSMEQATAAIVNNQAGVIDLKKLASGNTANDLLNAMNTLSTKNGLLAGIKIITSDAPVYTDHASALADIANGAKVLTYNTTNSKYEYEAPKKIAIKISNAPTATDVEVGKRLATSILSGGYATTMTENTNTNETQVIVGSFEWLNPDSVIAEAGDALKHKVVFTPVDLQYDRDTAEVDVKAIQYFTVIAGASLHGKVEIASANAANKYVSGTQLTVSYTPDTHYTSASSNQTSYTVTKNDTIVGAFDPIMRTVTIGSVTNGELTVKNGATTLKSGDKVIEGAQLNITATPSTRYKLASLTNGSIRLATMR